MEVPKSVGIFIICFCVIFNNAQSQVELVGTSSNTIFSTNSLGVPLRNEYYFDKIDASDPRGIVYSDNKIYGTTYRGGNFNSGTIYEYDLVTDSFKLLYSFNENYLANPQGSIYIHNGVLYGSAEQLGQYNRLRLFSYNLDTGVIEIIDAGILNNLDLDMLFYPYGGDTVISVSRTGGNQDRGFIYKLDLKSKEAIKVADFANFPLGQHPFGKILVHGNGSFYGFCQDNSSSFSDGMLYHYNSLTDQFSLEHEFNEPWGSDAKGEDPTDIMFHSDSIIMGIASDGGSYEDGVLFEYNLRSRHYEVKVDFGFYRDVSSPSKIIKASNGKYYGMIGSGYSGSGNYGAIYEFDLNNDTFRHIHDFQEIDGYGTPSCAFVQMDSTKIIGYSSRGGNSSGGTIFTYDISNELLTTSLNFNSSHNGDVPVWIMEVNDSLIFGTTYQGGDENLGVFYKFNSITKEYAKILDFKNDSLLGYGPTSKYSIGENNLVYGSTQFGGKYYNGVLFSINVLNDSIEKLYDFGADNKRSYITSQIVLQESNKLFFAVMKNKSFKNEGFFFEFDIKTKKVTEYPLLPFGDIEYYPYGNLIFIDNETVACLASSDKPGVDNALIKYNLITNQVELIMSFDYQVGEGPHNLFLMPGTNLIYGFSSNIYTNSGRVFDYNIATGRFNFIKDFDYSKEGNLIQSDIILASNKNFYGFINKGYQTPNRIFEYNPQINQIRVFDTIPNSYSSFSASLTELKGLFNKYLLNNVKKPFFYPNPVLNEASILLEKEVTKAKVEIYDSRGILINEFNFYNKNKLDFVFDMKSGIYIAKIFVENKLLGSEKFIKVNCY